MKLDPKTKKAEIEKGHFFNEEFCDQGKKEENANFDLILTDKYKKPVAMKSIFISTFTIVEGSKSKKAMVLGNTKLIEDEQFRVVKFSIPATSVHPFTYKIVSRLDKKVYGEGEIK
nr:hypothetical protein BHI3_20140 [Bacteriovorax sp. HI3]